MATIATFETLQVSISISNVKVHDSAIQKELGPLDSPELRAGGPYTETTVLLWMKVCLPVCNPLLSIKLTRAKTTFWKKKRAVQIWLVQRDCQKRSNLFQVYITSEQTTRLLEHRALNRQVQCHHLVRTKQNKSAETPHINSQACQCRDHDMDLFCSHMS